MSSLSDGITKHPTWVLARTYDEVKRYAAEYNKPVKALKFVDGAHRIRQEIPEGTKFRLVRTGTWFLIDPNELKEIEFELKMRKEWME